MFMFRFRVDVVFVLLFLCVCVSLFTDVIISFLISKLMCLMSSGLVYVDFRFMVTFLVCVNDYCASCC